MVDGKISGFEQLDVWQQAQDVAVLIYSLTSDFPNDERFGLTNQVRRASASVSANIAEGFGRRGLKDKLQFYAIAYGSLLETKNFMYLASRLDYVSKETLLETIESITICQKQLNAFIRSHQDNS